jgi:hypothetical protein
MSNFWMCTLLFAEEKVDDVDLKPCISKSRYPAGVGGG